MADAAELLGAMRAATGALERRAIGYFVTGSVASSVHGEFRATNDLDLVADLAGSQLAPLFGEWSGEFVTDLDQARRALASGTSFNLIHRATFLKVDIFPCVSLYDREALRRAELIALPGGDAFHVATREDILLAKLRWYRLGDEQSEVQRRDIEHLVALNRGALDERYLRQWAAQLGVADLLTRSLEDS